MEEGYIKMGQKELQRWQVMSLVEVGKITLKEAGEKIGVSYRQTKRIRQAVKEKGIKGLIHGNVGRLSSHRTEEGVCRRIVELSRNKYAGFNDIHFTEQLEQREGIVLSRETVRKIRREAGILPKRKRRGKKHRKRRERKAQEGLMVIWDGSPHRWFGLNDPPCCLMAAMDDATGKLLAARFLAFEGTEGYLWLLRRMVGKYGIPASMYQDRHGALHRNDGYWSLEEQLAGRQEPTQVGWALEALGIRSIFALSPEAKGRIERLFNTLQDRLVAELGLEHITSIHPANVFLQSKFMKRFNARFAVSPKESEKAWREVRPHQDLDRLISFRYRAKVGNDNAVRLGGVIIDIPPGPKSRSYAQSKVEVRQLLDGSWRIYYQDNLIAKHPPTTLGEPIKAYKNRRRTLKGADSYSWVYLSSAENIYNSQLLPTPLRI
jgi:transposase